MSKMTDLIKKVALVDEELARELQVQMRRIGLLPPPARMEELGFLLKNKLISKREVLRRMNPEMSEEEVGALIAEAEAETQQPASIQIVQVPVFQPQQPQQPQPPNTGTWQPNNEFSWFHRDTSYYTPPRVTWTFDTTTITGLAPSGGSTVVSSSGTEEL